METLDIGISQEFIAQADTPYIITEASEMSQLIKPRKRFAFKNNFGHALLIAGLEWDGWCFHPSSTCLFAFRRRIAYHTYPCMQPRHPANSRTEAMVQNDVHELYFAEPVDLDNYQAIAIGPGIGQEEETALATFDQLADCYIPAVLDADAINT